MHPIAKRFTPGAREAVRKAFRGIPRSTGGGDVVFYDGLMCCPIAIALIHDKKLTPTSAVYCTPPGPLVAKILDPDDRLGPNTVNHPIASEVSDFIQSYNYKNVHELFAEEEATDQRRSVLVGISNPCPLGTT